MSKRWEIFCLIICTLIYLGASLVSMLVAIMSPIALDGEGGRLNPFAWLAFALMITLWIVCILAPFGAWVMFSRKRSQEAWTLMTVPPIWACVIALLLIFLSR